MRRLTPDVLTTTHALSFGVHWRELFNWTCEYLNRPPEHVDEATFWSLYKRGAQPLRAAPPELAGEPAELLCVITTYARPAACTELLSNLHAAVTAEACGAVWLLVLNDRSQCDYSVVREHAEALFGARLLWLDACERLGKPGFWKAYQVVFLAARALRPERALFLQDDLGFEADLMKRVHVQWAASASDPTRRVLYLFSSDEDERFGRWVISPRRTVSGGLRRTQWFDLQAFFVDRAFFELLGWRMIPIHPNRWRRQPKISSGVGKQLTIRLRRRGSVYQSYPPLVFHGAHKSEMNPDARARRALDNRGLVDREVADASSTDSRDS